MMIFTFIPPQLLLLWCALIKLPLSQASGSQCFRPNRDLASFDYPCEPSHSQSFCCGVGWLCAYDKVCYPTIQLGEGWTAFPPTSGSCTDISWESSECPKRCLSTNLGMLLPWLGMELAFLSSPFPITLVIHVIYKYLHFC